MALGNLEDVKSVILQMSAQQRQALQSWWVMSYGRDAGYFRSDGEDRLGDHVAEAVATYGGWPGRHGLSVDEYLEFEANSEHRHEYIDGTVYAMAGVSERHQLIAGNLFAAIHGHLRGGPCKPYMSDFKVRLLVENKDLFYYPDVMVACSREGVSSHYLRYPKLVVEVLSPSTEAIDRREKFLSYTQIRTVEEYALFSQEAAQLALYRRAQSWVPQGYSGPGESATFESIGLSVALAEVYEGVF